MKLFLFGIEINSEYELEINTEEDFGFDIEVKYKEDVYDDAEDIYHNCTEFHHLYNKKGMKDFPDRISSAFESDIHSTGCTRQINLLEYIKVDIAKVLHEKY